MNQAQVFPSSIDINQRKSISATEGSHMELRPPAYATYLVSVDLLSLTLNVLFMSCGGLLLFLDDLMTLRIS